MKFIRTIGIALAALGLSTAGLAGTEPGRVWTHNTLSGSNYATQASIGDRGGQVFTLIPGVGGKVRLVSGATIQGGEQVWEAPLAYQVLSGRVASAQNAPFHAAVSWERSSSGAIEQLVLRAFAGSSMPILTRTIYSQAGVFPTIGVHLSDDGTKVYAWRYDSASMLIRIEGNLLPSGAALPSRTLQCSTSPVQATLSAAGESLFFTAGGIDTAIDLTTGQAMYNYIVNGGLAANANALAVDTCDHYAGIRGFGTYTVLEVYQRWTQPDAPYTHTSWFTQTFQGNEIANNCALSPSGDTLAVATSSNTMAGKLAIEFYDLTQTTHPRTQRIQMATSPAGSYMTRMEFAGEDRLVCVSSLSATSPEVYGFLRSSGTWTISSQAESTVAATDLRTSRDGRASLTTCGIPTGGATIESKVTLIDLSARNLELRSVPHAGNSADLRLYATPGSRAQVLLSTYLAPNPITFNNIGTLYVGTSGLIRVPAGIVPASGYLDMAFPMPAQPGQTRYLQSFATNPRQLGSSALQVTTVP
jgi:hypothetical protein